MAASIRCGQARIQPVSQVPHAATATTPAGSVEGRGTVSGDGEVLLLSPAAGERGIAWEQAYPGDEGQLRRLRAEFRPPLRNCPMADDVILLMSELGGNAVRHSRSRGADATFTARLLDVPGQYVLGEIEDGGSDWTGDLQGSARKASGLDLLLKLSDACGVSGDESRRVVWFRLRYPAGGARHAGQAGCTSER
jgi:serine/threonine-protein kinase RsbW